MTHEQNPNQFNKETFKNEFEIAFSKYFNAGDMLINQYLFTLDENATDSSIQEKIAALELQKKKGMEEMIKISTQALKLAPDKQEVIDIIYNKFYETDIAQSKPYESHELADTFAELDFFKKIVLELLKGK